MEQLVILSISVVLLWSSLPACIGGGNPTSTGTTTAATAGTGTTSIMSTTGTTGNTNSTATNVTTSATTFLTTTGMMGSNSSSGNGSSNGANNSSSNGGSSGNGSSNGANNSSSNGGSGNNGGNNNNGAGNNQTGNVGTTVTTTAGPNYCFVCNGANCESVLTGAANSPRCLSPTGICYMRYNLKIMQMNMNCTSTLANPGLCTSQFMCKAANSICEYCCTTNQCNIKWSMKDVIDDCTQEAAADSLRVTTIKGFATILVAFAASLLLPGRL